MNTPEDKQLMEEIRQLKEKKSVYIIAHYYQRDEIQDIADFVGDSYAMAVAAKNSPLDTILVAGVDFMAESAAILCPGKTVLSPEPTATCPMANSITVDDVRQYKETHPDSIIVSYVNTPAAIKAVSDICCTSSNAVKIIEKLPPDKRIFFIPDENLGTYVASKLKRSLDFYPSCCPIHAAVKKETLLQRQAEFPDAKVLVHPECDPEVVAIADYVGSTAGMVNYAAQSSAHTFIIVTEAGIMCSVESANPGKELVLADEGLICTNMKLITLDKILHSLHNFTTVITVPENIRVKAALALEKMIAYTQ